MTIRGTNICYATRHELCDTCWLVSFLTDLVAALQFCANNISKHGFTSVFTLSPIIQNPHMKVSGFKPYSAATYMHSVPKYVHMFIFYLRRASDARVLAVIVCLWVCHTPVLYQNR